MPLQQIVPTWLAWNASNDTSPTGMANVRTGAPYFAGGLNLGDYWDATEAEANAASNSTGAFVGPIGTGVLHAGRYRRVQVDSGATASNVKTGTIGYMVAGGQPQLNLVTSYDKAIPGAHPVVFLNAITPGNYGQVQELGVATCLCGATVTKSGPAAGDLINATTLGVVDDPTVQELVPTSIGIALDPPLANTLIRVYMTVAPTAG
jgi:hypothetical protein